MCFENLKSKHHELLQFLKTENYSATTIRVVTNEITSIIENAEKSGWQTYRNVYHAYEAQGLSKSVLRSKRHCLRMLKRFDIQGEFPDRTRRSYAFERDAYENLPDEFKELIAFYREYDLMRGKKQTTIYHEALNTVTFLCAMQQCGCSSLDEIREKDVLSFFLSGDGQLIRGCSYKKNVAAVFKAGLHWKEEPCRRILTCFPALRESRKTIQYLTGTETDRIRETLHSKVSRLSLRDRAVGTLLLYTGLRGCDIAELLFQSVDWDKEILSIIQRKTAVPMELPLTPVIGNALFDYVDSERPSSDDPHIFLSEAPPYHPLASQSIGNIALRIYQAAGIRQNPGDRKGTHIFRHHAASHMLECGVPQPVISRTLGHTAPDSLEPYLMADFRHLKECALSVAAFPVPEEVLAL